MQSAGIGGFFGIERVGKFSQIEMGCHFQADPEEVGRDKFLMWGE